MKHYSSVIERAGGFTSESFVKAAVFTREDIKLKEQGQLIILGDTIRREHAARSMTVSGGSFSCYFRRSRGWYCSINGN